MHIRRSRRDGCRGAGLRWGQLLALSGLTGFAVSQPLLAVAGDNPSMFTFADVQGWRLFAFALAVAVVPPVVLWVLVLIAGAVGRRAGDVAFLAAAAVLVGLAVVQWVKLAGVERRLLVAIAAAGAAALLAWALARSPAATTFVRYTAVLPLVAFLSFVFSPSGDLLWGSRSALADPDGEAPPSVVFIMLDEFPTMSILADDRNVGAGRFPNLAEFAQDATWYRDFTTKSSATLQAVPSMLTGRNPVEDRSGLWTRHPDNLFDLLAATHELEASESSTQLCGYSTCELTSTGSAPGLGQVFRDIGGVWRQRVSLDPIGPPDLGQFEEEAQPLVPEDRRSREGGLQDPEFVLRRPDRVTDFLESLAQPTGTSLHYLHLLLPHQPWVHYPDGTTYGPAEELSEAALPFVPAGNWGMVEREQAHLFQAEYTDRLLGEIFDTLRATGRYDDSLIVVTADHGIGFRTWPVPRTLDVDTPEQFAGVSYVPLFIKEPGQTEGRIDDSNLMGPDLLPTVAHILGIDLPGEHDGLPTGHSGIEQRGDRKEIYDFGNDFATAELQGIVEFDSSSRPMPDMRWTGTADASEQPLAGLFSHLGVEEYLGADPAELPVVAGGTARVGALDAVSSPPPGDAALGYLHGEVADEPGDGTLLVAFDGEITSTSPVAGGAFRAPLPPPDEDGTRGDLVLLHLVDGDLRQLDVAALG